MGAWIVACLYFTVTSDSTYTLFDSFDWFDPSYLFSYKYFNQTLFHIVEASILLFCYSKHRHYPKEFNITQEIFWATLLNWIFNNHLELSPHLIENDAGGCVFGVIHFKAFSDCIKALGFVIVLWYLTNKSDNYFPLPFTWIFKDLSKFIFEQTCIKVYRDYLIKKEPEGSFIL